MIARIARMTFSPDMKKDFLQLFKKIRSEIRNFPGCHELCDLNRISTFSIWDTESSLDKYRSYDLFIQNREVVRRWMSIEPEAITPAIT